MRKLSEEKLDEICGGTNNVTGPIVNALIGVIDMIKDAGYSLGSGLRRIIDNHLCPLK